MENLEKIALEVYPRVGEWSGDEKDWIDGNYQLRRAFINGMSKALSKPNDEEKLLSQILRLDQAYNLQDVLKYLTTATDKLLIDKGYDGHDYEEMQHCSGYGKGVMEAINNYLRFKNNLPFVIPGWWVVIDNKNPNTFPKDGEKVIGELEHWESKNKRYYELKKVKESDCIWRTVDDNSEVSYDWNVIRWMPLPLYHGTDIKGYEEILKTGAVKPVKGIRDGVYYLDSGETFNPDNCKNPFFLTSQKWLAMNYGVVILSIPKTKIKKLYKNKLNVVLDGGVIPQEFYTFDEIPLENFCVETYDEKDILKWKRYFYDKDMTGPSPSNDVNPVIFF